MKIDLRKHYLAFHRTLCFGTDSFYNISRELNKYHKSVEKHYEQFERAKGVWSKISGYLREAY